ncbi:amidohydrolase family protein [Microvenator marinus]|uniref:Amidohydrolase family protein n=1 Tax=Microvenator marinus TaxID=2600177 RepID=A0A5B8XWQ0_9DELT|nr:amidohydrolase family protein [Microvenator marinus]QED29388.1 amidohydrolase family protein [Microvenator marinus]
MRTLLLIIVLVLVASPAAAQVLIKNARIYDESGQLITTNILTGADGKIATIDTVILAPPGVKTIDCGECIVTPGLVEVGTPAGLVEVWSVAGTRDHTSGQTDAIRASFQAADGINPDSAVLPVIRSGGITSVLSVPAGGIISGQSAWLDLAVRPLVINPNLAMHANLGEYGSRDKAASRADVVLHLREVYEDLDFFLANQANFDQNRSRELGASRLDLLALQRTRQGMPVVIEAHRASDIEKAIELGKELGIEIVISGATEAWVVAEKLAQAKVPVIVNPIRDLPSKLDRIRAREDALGILEKAGVEIIISSFDVHRANTLRQIAGNAVAFGMTHAGAIRAVTTVPAAVFGMQGYGQIEVGARANLVVWSGDPLELKTSVRHIVVGGFEVENRSRQTDLLEKYRNLDRRAAPAKAPAQFETPSAEPTRGEGPRGAFSVE